MTVAYSVGVDLDQPGEPPWSQVVPWVAPAGPGAVGAPVARADRSRGHPDLSSSSSTGSRPVHGILGSTSNPCKIKDFQGFLMIFDDFPVN